MLRPLRAAVEGWKPGAPISADPLTALIAAWPSIVGADVAQNSRPLDIARDTLVVATRSSAWSQQLSFLSERILRGMRARDLGPQVDRLRFKVGKVGSSVPGTFAPRRTRATARTRVVGKIETAEEAVALFRADVDAAERAKAAAGWKACLRCGVRIAPSAGSHCLPCENAESDARAASVSRLLFDVPWLGFEGIEALVPGVSLREYEWIRRRLLGKWWEALGRVRRSQRKTMTQRERLMASSYVLLKSGIDPERIAPPIVRELLGDEIHDILYGTEIARTHVK